jgi:mono/diheme cytochrome c family protein
MKHRWILATIVIALIACIAIVPVLIRDSDDAQSASATSSANELIAQGRYLALAGNCAGCHTARGGAVYAGGRAIETPFGSVYASNITPDIETGIGNWSADDFWRALHNGKSKNGMPLYPAFPYPNYTRVTRADADALFAYLRTLAPVRQANREHALRFPYNNRLLLVGWRALYFRPGVFKPDAGRSNEWNRGAYLVRGLGHCNTCHTGRDALGGERKADLAGGMIPVIDWYAPSLTPDAETGLGEWQSRDIVEYLKSGAGTRGAAFGPMAEVVYKSLQHLTDADIQAMADFLKALPKTPAPEDAAAPPVAQSDFKRVMARGVKLYEEHCADCHAADGKGNVPAYPPLAGNRSLTMRTAANPIRMVLNGGFAPGTAGNPRPYGMPPFRALLSDDDVAAVVSYVRNSWGNRAGFVSPVEVDRFRSAPPD